MQLFWFCCGNRLLRFSSALFHSNTLNEGYQYRKPTHLLQIYSNIIMKDVNNSKNKWTMNTFMSKVVYHSYKTTKAAVSERRVLHSGYDSNCQRITCTAWPDNTLIKDDFVHHNTYEKVAKHCYWGYIKDFHTDKAKENTKSIMEFYM